MKSEDELRELYRGEYVAAFSGQHTHGRLTSLLARLHLQDNLVIADFACGNALLMDLLATRAALYVGIDFSEEFIAAARQRQQAAGIENAELHCCDIREYCNSHPARFDAAFALDFSEHVYDPQWLELLQAMRSSIKPGGTLHLHTPDGDFFIELMKSRNFLLRQFPEHIAVRNAEHNARLLAQAGFEAITVRHVAHYNVLRWLHPLSYLPLVGRWFGARLLISARKPG